MAKPHRCGHGFPCPEGVSRTRSLRPPLRGGDIEVQNDVYLVKIIGSTFERGSSSRHGAGSTTTSAHTAHWTTSPPFRRCAYPLGPQAQGCYGVYEGSRHSRVEHCPGTNMRARPNNIGRSPNSHRADASAFTTTVIQWCVLQCENATMHARS